MNKRWGFLGSLGLGALLIYIFDPQTGRRRRALLADKARRFGHNTLDAMDVTSRDLKNRVTGWAAETRNLVTHRDVSDDVLVQPVRSKLGALWGARKLTVLGSAVATLGAAIATRAFTNMEFKRLIGLGARRNAITIHKIINIAAPVEHVFDFWSNYQNFPLFMSNVRDVKSMGENRSHWVVAGPAGAPIEWNAVLTNCIPNQSLGWETTPESAIQHTGIVRFQPNAEGGTRLDVRMSYNPVAGALGHTVAALFGADPKSEIDQDLARMKTMIETGIPPHDAARKDETTYTH